MAALEWSGFKDLEESEKGNNSVDINDVSDSEEDDQNEVQGGGDAGDREELKEIEELKEEEIKTDHNLGRPEDANENMLLRQRPQRSHD